MSNDLFNRHTGFCLACPITNTNRGYRFHVPIPEGLDVAGFVIVDQVKSLDFRSREAVRVAKAPPEVLDEVLALLDAVLFGDQTLPWRG